MIDLLEFGGIGKIAQIEVLLCTKCIRVTCFVLICLLFSLTFHHRHL
jgi:hypothetical protein